MTDVIWRSWRRARVLLLLAGAVVALVAVGGAAGQSPTRLVPIGAGYESDTLELFAAQAAAHDSDGVVTIRVLPISYHTNPDTISDAKRADNLELAQFRADQIAEACAAVAAAAQTCVSTVVDIQIRSDALDPARLAQLGPEVDGYYILGGDQTVAMRVVANTPAEAAITEAFLGGAAVGGNSAGAAVISRYMIGGYLGDNFAWHGLHQGALDLWYGPDETETRGFVFGLEEAVIDQHVLERGRTARLIQAMVEKPGDKLAVGFDWGTAGVIDENGVVSDITGWYAAIALDGETYGAAAGAQYIGSDPAILDIHDVAFHVLPPGPYAYAYAWLFGIYTGITVLYTIVMTTIKTAVSIEESLFRRVEELAGELQVPRSRIFSMALESYIERYDTQKLIDILNVVYADGLTAEEKEDMEAMRHLQAKLLEDEQW